MPAPLRRPSVQLRIEATTTRALKFIISPHCEVSLITQFGTSERVYMAAKVTNWRTAVGKAKPVWLEPEPP